MNAAVSTVSTDQLSGLNFPSGLYGRNTAYARLATAWAEASGGQRVLALVSGYSGVGKTALAQRLKADVNAGSGFFIAGKYDQVRRSIPYLGIGEALTSLAQQLMALPPGQYADRSRELRAAAGEFGRVLLDLAPALTPVLGDLPPVPALPGIEARHRCTMVFRNFIAAAGCTAHPLVIFLDDLQWVDGASLDLFRAMACDEAEVARGGLLLVAAYRENEVDASHPFTRAIHDAEAVGLRVRRISLGGLLRGEVRSFLADLLDAGAETARPETLALADVLQAKTAGNPFFLRMLLLHLYGSGALTDHTGHWEWNADAVARLSVAENVAELVSTRLYKLSDEVRTILAVAACLGGSFPIALLAEATDLSIAALLNPARGSLITAGREGLIQMSGDTVAFVHDRVQQAALALAPIGEQPALRLTIGRRLLRSHTPETLAGHLFIVATQYLEAAPLVVDPTEKLQIARLHLRAGERARAAAAFGAAHDFLTAGIALLPADVWQSKPDLALNLHREGMLAAYAAARHDEVAALFALLQHNVADPLALVECAGCRVGQLTMQGFCREAVDLALEFFRRLGFPVDLDRIDAETAALLAEAEALLATPGVLERLAEAPLATDPRYLAAIALSSTFAATSFYAARKVFILLALRAFVWAPQRGLCPGLPENLPLMNMVLIHVRANYAEAGRIASTAIAAARRLGDRHSLGWTLHLVALTVSHWHRPLRDALDLAHEGFTLLHDTGDLEFSSYPFVESIALTFELGVPLSEAMAEVNAGLSYAGKTGNSPAESFFVAFRQTIRALRGETTQPNSFGDKNRSDAQWRCAAEPNPMALGHHLICRLVLATLAGAWEDAVRFADEAEADPWGFTGFLLVATHRFHGGIARCRLAATTTGRRRIELLGKAALDLQQMRTWAGLCPENFAHRAALQEAELSALNGQDERASAWYEAAVSEASAHGFTHDAALAHELAGRFHLARDDKATARRHIDAARQAFAAWGATAHVGRLAAEFHFPDNR